MNVGPGNPTILMVLDISGVAKNVAGSGHETWKSMPQIGTSWNPACDSTFTGKILHITIPPDMISSAMGRQKILLHQFLHEKPNYPMKVQ